MDNSESDASHLQQDSGGLIADLDVKEYLETRERNARADRAFAYKTRILDRAREVTNRTHQHEMKVIRNSLHDLAAKTPNFRSIPHCIHSGNRPRSYASLKLATMSKNYDTHISGKDDNRKFRSKSLPALERRLMLSPHSHSEAGGSQLNRNCVPPLSTVIRCRTVDPQEESYKWSRGGKPESLDSTPREVKSREVHRDKQAFKKHQQGQNPSDDEIRPRGRGKHKTLPPLKLREEHWRNSTKNIMRRNKFVQNSLSNLYRKRRRPPSILEEQTKPNYIIQREFVGQPTTTIHDSFDVQTSQTNGPDPTDWRITNEILKI